jgi:anti-sigma factor RsiW
MSSRNESTDEPSVARDATYYRAPDALRARIKASVAAQAREQRRPVLWRWGGMGAAFATIVLLAWNVVLLQLARGTVEDGLAREVASAHVRSLLAEGHLNDVASTDRHTVKPWFQGKLDFAPAVADLAAAGYPLTGGRLDYIGGRPVAALTYRHRLHVVNVFEWPAAGGDEKPVLVDRHGYAMVRWKFRGMEYWAISDAAGSELVKLAQLLSAS